MLISFKCANETKTFLCDLKHLFLMLDISYSMFTLRFSFSFQMEFLLGVAFTRYRRSIHDTSLAAGRRDTNPGRQESVYLCVHLKSYLSMIV